MDNFFSNIPHIVLNDKFEITYAHDDIKANYQVFMSNGYFKNLLSGYTLADFIDPVQISFSPVDTNSCNLTFYLNGNSLYCIPVQVKEHKYAQSKNSISDILREPVPSIMSSLNIISDNIEKRSIDYKKIYAGIDTINSNSLRIYKNITNMSLVSKIMSGHWPDKQAVDFSSIIKNVADSVTKFVPIVHVNLDVENNIFIDGNADFMTNAITNLFANSIMFREDEYVKVDIMLTSNNNYAVFSYSDNSKGIQDEFLPHIFQPYFSRDPYNDGEISPSLGLGLFIVKSAFDQAGANIILSSSFDKGGVKYNANLPLTKMAANSLASESLWLVRSRLSTVAVQLSDVIDIPYEK